MLRFAATILLVQLIVVQREDWSSQIRLAILIERCLSGTLAGGFATILVPGFDGVDLQGEQGGVGPDGTTFVLSGTVNTDGFSGPVTRMHRPPRFIVVYCL